MLLASVLSLALFADPAEDVVNRGEIVTVDETLATAHGGPSRRNGA